LIIVSYDQPAWEQISFGVRSLDPFRQILSEKQVRTSIAQCLDRDQIAAARNDAGTTAENLYHPRDPRNSPENTPLIYQPQQARDILESLGWVDNDQDPGTPRVAAGVDGIPQGTVLQLSLLVPDLGEDNLTAIKIKEQLAGCGIDLEIQYLPSAELLAPGPDGPVFGRQFDLALFAWSTGSYHLCQIYQSEEIPGIYPASPKGWGGANATGYSQEDFDRACNRVLTSLPDSGESLEASLTIQALYQEDLPALPLFFRREILLYSPDLDGIQEGSNPPLVSIEYIR
jgi:peptide/nickel transport system substrate-binding protein